ncbi:MAG: hypothetical protein U9M90_03455 [Patescibacteria group bacterium]|nr:hypothetical protein [Patescibacteria group bacterium]
MRKNNKEKEKQIKKSQTRKFLILGVIILFFIAYSFYAHKKMTGKVELLEGLSIENIEKIELEQKIRSMVSGYPIEDMVPCIIEKDPKVAAFMISIAKKESDWGRRCPKYKGRDCFNYWGYKGPNRIGSGGHSCFNSRKEAVDIVSKRIETLVYQKDLNTPAKMIVWKCGSTCSGHNSFGVRKWINDVNYYYKELQTRLYQTL